MSTPQHQAVPANGLEIGLVTDQRVRIDVEWLPLAACLLDASMNMLQSNAAWCELFRCSPEVTTSSAAWLDLIAVEDREMVRTQLLDATRTSPINFVFRLAGEAPARAIEVSARAVSEKALLALMRAVIAERAIDGNCKTGLHEFRPAQESFEPRPEHASERSYWTVFDAVPAPIILLDAQATVADANACALALYGYLREEVIGLSVACLINDQAQLESLFRSRCDFLPAAMHCRRDGSMFCAETTLSYVQLGDTVLAIAAVRDVTEERRNLDRLQEAEERWRFALEGADDGVWDWNVTTNHFYHSPRWREMLGYSVEATDIKWNALLHPDDKQCVLGNLEAYLHGDSPLYEAEFRLRCADGSYKWIAARGKTVARDSSGRPLRMLGTHRDITESRRMMDTLRASEQRWQFALEGHGDGLWDWNLVTGRVMLSPQFKHILGYQPEDLEHLVSLVELIHPDERKRAREAFEDHLAAHVSLLSVETRLRTRDGQFRWVALRGKVMEYGSLNRPTRMIGTLRDIHESKQREEWERRQHEQLAHAARLIALGEMASALAHELNQPLTAIRNFSGLGLRRLGESTPDGVRKTLEIIGEQSMRAGEIVRRVRGFVNKADTALLAVQLNTVIEDMVQLAQMDARTMEVQVVLELQPDLPVVKGDRIGLEQVVMNLLKNGIEAMTNTHGERRITVRTALRSDASIECSISDFGEGLSDSVMPMLFEPFVTTKENGMGLGLSICRTIVENHRGRLWVEPTEGRGASFHFSVPIETEAQHG